MQYTLKLSIMLLLVAVTTNFVGCTDLKPTPSPSPSPTLKAVAKTPADVLLAKVEKLTSQGVLEELSTSEQEAVKSYKQELATVLVKDERKKIVSKITFLSKIYDHSSSSLQANGKQKLANEAKSISLQLDKALASYVVEANKSKKITP
jgi:type IV pilus biogenesis protein CpaD/CtpE